LTKSPKAYGEKTASSRNVFGKTGYLHAVTVRKYRPQSDHVERSDLAKRFFIAGWERERAESQESEGERGRGLNTPQWDSA
jgi:hypothetical protein